MECKYINHPNVVLESECILSGSNKCLTCWRIWSPFPFKTYPIGRGFPTTWDACSGLGPFAVKKDRGRSLSPVTPVRFPLQFKVGTLAVLSECGSYHEWNCTVNLPKLGKFFWQLLWVEPLPWVLRLHRWTCPTKTVLLYSKPGVMWNRRNHRQSRILHTDPRKASFQDAVQTLRVVANVIPRWPLSSKFHCHLSLG